MTAYEKRDVDRTFGNPGRVEGGVKCAYPNCHVPPDGKITGEEAYVSWTTDLDLNALYERFHPVVKLAIEENGDKYQKKYNAVLWTIVLHPECATEWGMHLIKDGLQADGHTGRLLSGRG